MGDEEIKASIASALRGLIDRQKTVLRTFYDESDAEHNARARKLEPLFDALLLIKAEVGDIAEISVAQAGHQATVYFQDPTSVHLVLSTNYGSAANTKFHVEHKEYPIMCDPTYSELTFETEDEVLKFVLEKLAKAVAYREVLAERKKQ